MRKLHLSSENKRNIIIPSKRSLMVDSPCAHYNNVITLKPYYVYPFYLDRNSKKKFIWPAQSIQQSNWHRMKLDNNLCTPCYGIRKHNEQSNIIWHCAPQFPWQVRWPTDRAHTVVRTSDLRIWCTGDTSQVAVCCLLYEVSVTTN